MARFASLTSLLLLVITLPLACEDASEKTRPSAERRLRAVTFDPAR